MPARARSLPLDVLRALAILLVLFHHLPREWVSSVPLPRGVVQTLRLGGWMGVDLFFVLSGFLIAGLLFQEHRTHGEIRFRHFFLRRGFKIYPAFYVFLAVTVAVRYVQSGRVPANTWKELVFLQNYLGGLWNHTWSLAVEEHFYILLPLLLILLLRTRGRPDDPFRLLPRICLLVALSVLALRGLNAYLYDYSIRVHFCPTEARIDALMFGVLLSYLYHYRNAGFLRACTRFAWPMALVGLWLWTPTFFTPVKDTAFLYTLGFTQTYVGSGLILCALVARGIPGNALTRGLGYVGRYSYSIYLWHPAVREWGPDALERALGVELSPGAGLIVYLAGSLALGIAMSRLVELPVLRLRDRILPSRSRPLADRGEILPAARPGSATVSLPSSPPRPVFPSSREEPTVRPVQEGSHPTR